MKGIKLILRLLGVVDGVVREVDGSGERIMGAGEVVVMILLIASIPVG